MDLNESFSPAAAFAAACRRRRRRLCRPACQDVQARWVEPPFRAATLCPLSAPPAPVAAPSAGGPPEGAVSAAAGSRENTEPPTGLPPRSRYFAPLRAAG